jgi:hypothetical protein
VAGLLSEADIERVVFDSPSRVIDVGRKRRFYRGGLRRAIQVRDRVCFHPTCDDVPEREEIDHREPAAHGGATSQANGRVGCRFHNNHRHHTHWRDDAYPTGDDLDDQPEPDDLHGPDPPDDG